MGEQRGGSGTFGKQSRMCGRYTYPYTWRELFRLLNLHSAEPGPDFQPSWNIAPTQVAPVVVATPSGAEGRMMRWGFTPAWAKDAPTHPINARSETVASSAMFRDSFKHRRCIVPAGGFYEWKQGETPKSAKQAYFITLLGQPIMLFAGLWTPGVDDAPPTFTVLTTAPNELMAGIHNRMPVIVRPESVGAWVGSTPLADASSLFAPFPAQEMCAVAVSSRVNSPRNNDPSLLTPVEPGKPPTDSGMLPW